MDSFDGRACLAHQVFERERVSNLSQEQTGEDK